LRVKAGNVSEDISYACLPAGREIYINKIQSVNDITYMSELIPAALLHFAKQSEAAGINSPKQLTFISCLTDRQAFRKLWAH